MPFSDYSKDNFIATALSEFTTADIPDMSQYDPESRFWLAHYVLNTMLRAQAPSPVREFTFNFLRRSVIAFQEHDLARVDTLNYLSAKDERLMAYFSALHHWEEFLGASWHALATLGQLTDERVFPKGATTPEARLNAIYNASKHAESRIAAGQMPEVGLLPVWLFNDGIRSTDSELTFAETGEVLATLADLAGALVDPLTTTERLEALANIAGVSTEPE